VGKAAFDELAASSQQLFAIVSSDSVVVGLDRLPLALLAFPVALARLLSCWNITKYFALPNPLDDRAAVIIASQVLKVL
jgi:hypothetical protein